MDLELKAGSRSHAVAVWQRIRAQFVRLPATARVMLGLFLLAALLMAMHTAYWGKDASLRLKVQHSLRGGQISVWVDGELAYLEAWSAKQKKVRSDSCGAGQPVRDATGSDWHPSNKGPGRLRQWHAREHDQR
jgi:hypothetical protein